MKRNMQFKVENEEQSRILQDVLSQLGYKGQEVTQNFSPYIFTYNGAIISCEDVAHKYNLFEMCEEVDPEIFLWEFFKDEENLKVNNGKIKVTIGDWE